MYTIQGQRILVLGGGKSGVAAALLAQHHGASVLLSTLGTLEKEQKERIQSLGIQIEEGAHTLAKVYRADLVVKSPGIPPTASILQWFQTQSAPVEGEVAFGMRFVPEQVTTIGVTGSNGKSTVVHLLQRTMLAAGKRSNLCGNIGIPICQVLLEEPRPEVLVIELSSYQLDDAPPLGLDIAVLLNISSDHLDRYGTMEKYAKSKSQITAGQSSSDLFVYYGQDEYCTRIAQRSSARVCSFGSTPSDKAVVKEAMIQLESIEYSLSDVCLLGPHNVRNFAAVMLVAQSQGILPDRVIDANATFQGLPHRMQTVRKIRNVTFVNDSKATNLDSAKYALERFQLPTIWIAGGEDKGNDYAVLDNVISHVHWLIIIGENPTPLLQAFQDKIPAVVYAKTMKKAFDLVHQWMIEEPYAENDQVVLLAPACASFDQYQRFEKRGEDFEQCVHSLYKNIEWKN